MMKNARTFVLFTKSNGEEFFIILSNDIRVHGAHVTGMGGKRYIPHRFWEQAVFHELAMIPLSERHVVRALFGNRFHFTS